MTAQLHFGLLRMLYNFLNLFYLRSEEENVAAVLYRFLKESNVKMTYSSILEYTDTHPSSRYLKCICDFFDDIGLPNYTLKLEKSDILGLDRPFIAVMKDYGGKIAIIYSINDQYIVYADSLKGKNILEKNIFFKNWTGVIIGTKKVELF